MQIIVEIRQNTAQGRSMSQKSHCLFPSQILVGTMVCSPEMADTVLTSSLKAGPWLQRAFDLAWSSLTHVNNLSVKISSEG